MVEKILNDTTPYGKIRASHEGSLHSSTLIRTFPFLFKRTALPNVKRACLLCLIYPPYANEGIEIPFAHVSWHTLL